MLSATPFEVVAEFFSNFASLDKFETVKALSVVPTIDHLRHRRQAHLDRPQPQAARLHRRLQPARVRGRRTHGDHGAARRRQRRARPPARRGRRPGRPPVTSPVTVRRPATLAVRPSARGRADRARDRARRLRGPAAGRPARRRARRDRGVARRRTARTVAWSRAPTARDVGALVLDPERSHALAAPGRACSPRCASTASPRRWWPRRWPTPRTYDDVAVLAREELPGTVAFWREHGFAETGRHSPYVELRRAAPAAYDTPDAESMRALGASLASVLRAGDVVVLSGELGRRQDDADPGARRRAGGPRRRHLADVRDRPRAPVAGRRSGPGARRRLSPRRGRRARRPRPRHLARRRGHGGRVGGGCRRGSGRRPAGGTHRARGRRRRRRRRARPATGACLAGRWPLARRTGCPRSPPEQAEGLREEQHVGRLVLVHPEPGGGLVDGEAEHLDDDLAVGRVGRRTGHLDPRGREGPGAVGVGKVGMVGSGLRERTAWCANTSISPSRVQPASSRSSRAARSTSDSPASRLPPGRNRHSSADRQTTTQPSGPWRPGAAASPGRRPARRGRRPGRRWRRAGSRGPTAPGTAPPSPSRPRRDPSPGRVERRRPCQGGRHVRDRPRQ